MRKRLKELLKYPSAILGLAILVFFLLFSVYTVFALPYNEAISLWRGGPGVWDESPRRASPIYFDWFTKNKLPRTIVTTLEDDGKMTVVPVDEGKKEVEIVLPFSYAYDGFPKELSLFTEASLSTSREQISVYLRRPDGDIITLDEDIRIRPSHSYRISQDMSLRLKLGGGAPHVALFAENPTARSPKPLHGDYELIVTSILSQADNLEEAKLVVYGQVHGLAGTDHLRRDMTIALRWGAPIGLLFGVLAAVGAQVSTFILGGIGTWFGGKVDSIFHRITEVMMVLPLLVVLIMVGHFYSRSIWVMLGSVILLSVFSASLKVYRAMFLQAKESPYIEAAQSYGAGNFRIIFKYLLPRLIPVLLPQFVTVIPTFVFLEATLAVLGLGDPVLPTWGKVIHDAQVNDALYMGNYYWMIQPAFLLMLIGFSFALVGYTLDRIFNPKLRKV